MLSHFTHVLFTYALPYDPRHEGIWKSRSSRRCWIWSMATGMASSDTTNFRRSSWQVRAPRVASKHTGVSPHPLLPHYCSQADTVIVLASRPRCQLRQAWRQASSMSAVGDGDGGSLPPPLDVGTGERGQRCRRSLDLAWAVVCDIYQQWSVDVLGWLMGRVHCTVHSDQISAWFLRPAPCD